MKTKAILILLALSSLCSAADINDVNALMAAAAAGGEYTIAAGTYMLPDDMNFARAGKDILRNFIQMSDTKTI